MREIKFRAWDKENKLMTKARPLHWLMFDVNNSYEPTRDLIWLQYTGLEDKNKNGVEIYEGDIVHALCTDEWQTNEIHDRNLEIVWRTADATFSFRGRYLPLSWGGFASLEVIGNIYENPELLK